MSDDDERYQLDILLTEIENNTNFQDPNKIADGPFVYDMKGTRMSITEFYSRYLFPAYRDTVVEAFTQGRLDKESLLTKTIEKLSIKHRRAPDQIRLSVSHLMNEYNRRKTCGSFEVNYLRELMHRENDETKDKICATAKESGMWQAYRQWENTYYANRDWAIPDTTPFLASFEVDMPESSTANSRGASDSFQVTMPAYSTGNSRGVPDSQDSG